MHDLNIFSGWQNETYVESGRVPIHPAGVLYNKTGGCPGFLFVHRNVNLLYD